MEKKVLLKDEIAKKFQNLHKDKKDIQDYIEFLEAGEYQIQDESEVSLLSNETETWKLLKRIFTFENKEKVVIKYSEDWRLNHYLIHKQFLQKNAEYKRQNILKDWLEEIFIKPETEPIHRESTRLYTLKILNEGVNDMNVTQIDPDSSFRESKRYHQTDEDENEKLLSEIFYFLRSGQHEKAIQYCQNSGEFWRSATIDSVTLYNDHETEKQKQNGTYRKEGNLNRKATMKVLFSLSEDDSLSNKERSLYGSLCGNSKAMNLSSETWYDYLWAELKSSIESSLSMAIENYPNEEFKVTKNVFEIIDSLPRRDYGLFNIIQSHLALEEHQNIVEYFNQILEKKDEIYKDQFHHILRFGTHLLTFFKGHKLVTETDAVIEHYIFYLASLKQFDLVIYFTLLLSRKSQIKVYSRILQDSDETEKKVLLDLAKGKLPIEEITRVVFDEIKKDQSKPSEKFKGITPEDRKKIDGLSVLTYLPSQYIEAFEQGIYLLRLFIPNEKYEGADLVIEKLSEIEKSGQKLLVNLYGEFLVWKAFMRTLHEHKEILASYLQKPDLSQVEHVKSWQAKFKKMKNNYYLCIDSLLQTQDWNFIDENLTQNCLPKITFLILGFLKSIGEYEKCFDLCCLIVSDSVKSPDSVYKGDKPFNIYSHFSKDELRALMSLFKDVQVDKETFERKD